MKTFVKAVIAAIAPIVLLPAMILGGAIYGVIVGVACWSWNMKNRSAFAGNWEFKYGDDK